MEKQTNAIEHIDLIIADIKDHIEKKSDFVGFILVALGIEYLGCFSDEKPFTDYGQSEIRFKNGLKFFKNKWYANNSQWLFETFRGPLIHQYRIGTNLVLTSKCKNQAELSLHLQKQEGSRVFVLEQLFEDYKNAVIKFKNEAAKPVNSFNKEKLSLLHQRIFPLQNGSSFDIIVSGATQSQFVTQINSNIENIQINSINVSSGM